MSERNWGVWSVCRGLMAGLARQGWAKSNGETIRLTEADAKDTAKAMNDGLDPTTKASGNVYYVATPFNQSDEAIDAQLDLEKAFMEGDEDDDEDW